MTSIEQLKIVLEREKLNTERVISSGDELLLLAIPDLQQIIKAIDYAIKLLEELRDNAEFNDTDCYCSDKARKLIDNDPLAENTK